MSAYGAFSALAMHPDTHHFTASDESGEEDLELVQINTPDALAAQKAEGLWPTGEQKRKQVPVRLFLPPLEELKLSPSRLQLISPDSVTPPSTPSPGGKRAMTPMESILQSSSGSSVDSITPRSSERSSPITPPRSPATVLDRKHHMRAVLKKSKTRLNSAEYKFYLEPNVFFEEMIIHYKERNENEQSDVARSHYKKIIKGLTLLTRQLNRKPSDTQCNEIFSSAYFLLFQEELPHDEKWLMRELCYQYSRFGVEKMELNPLEREHNLGFFHRYHIKVDTLFSELELVPSE